MITDRDEERFTTPRYTRSLDNLRGDARTAGAEFRAVLAGFDFVGERHVALRYERTGGRGAVPEDVLERVLHTVRSLGWSSDLVEMDDGTLAISVKVGV